MFTREDQIKKLDQNQEYDFVIIGGGASGLGVAVDAASRGFKVALFEAHDFAKGTSSRSTKLVHGGVRYLAQGNIKLVFEALKERGLLARNAGHLFKSQRFLVPGYTLSNKLFYGLGLKVYDWLSLRKSIGSSKIISANKAIKFIPSLKLKNLKGGVTYFDGQFDDARLALNLAQTAEQHGATVINYMKVIDMEKDADGKLTGVHVLDKETDKTYIIKAKVIINATGVFANKILKLAGRKKKSLKVVPSQGIHLVVDKKFVPSDTALMVPKTTDGRVLFAIPWHNKVVIGTTDTPIKKPTYEPIPEIEEIDFILQNASEYLTQKITKNDIKSIFAGLRPLVAPEGDKSNTKELSRGHKIIHSQSGLLTIVGGKWTTYREMAEDVVNEAIKAMGFRKINSKTESLEIHGNTNNKDILKSVNWYYGSDAIALEKLINEQPELNVKLHPDYPFTKGHVVWAVKHEMARSVEDVLARRTRLLFLDTEAAISASSTVAHLMKIILKKDDKWADEQERIFEAIAQSYLIKNL